jgi:hypothetical protein
MQLVAKQIENIETRVQNVSSGDDVAGLINKLDYKSKVNEGELKKLFANTTNQGREKIRRMATKILRLASNDKKKKN